LSGAGMEGLDVSHRILGELAFFLGLVIISEVSRQVARRQCPDNPIVTALLICSLALGWYSTSITLVLLNKWVMSSWMGAGLHFPIFYTMTHMVLKGVFAIVYLVFVRCQDLPPTNWRVIKTASGIGVLVGLDVVASNLSFQYITVTFYVMVKASALIWILVFGSLANLEACSPQIVLTVFIISSGIFFSTYGEADFSGTGFGLVLASEIFAAARWVGTQALMNDSEIDSVTAVLYMSPGSTLSLLPLVLARERAEVAVLLAGGRQTLNYAVLVLVPSFLAFALLILEVKLVKETSSLTLAVLGNLKSIMTILFAIVVFRETATPIQWCGVSLGTFGMLWYTYFKSLPPEVDKVNHRNYEVIPPAQAKELPRLPGPFLPACV